MRSSPVRYFPLVLTALLTAGVAVADLTEAWIVVLPQPGDFGGMALASDGSVFWVGSQGADHYLQRFDGDGARRYNRRVPGADVAALAVSPDDGAVVVAGSAITGAGEVPWIARYRADRGRRVWATTLDVYTRASVRAVAVSAAGDAVFVTGSQARSGVPGDRRVFVAKLSLDGTVLWNTEYDHDEWDEGWAIAVDPRSGDVYVGGRTGNFETLPFIQALLLRLDGDDGALRWASIEGRDEGVETVTALVVSPNGKRVFTTGFTDLEPGIEGRDWFFQQYLARNGKAKRQTLYDVTGSGPDNPAAMVRTDDGKTIFVAGEGCPGAVSRCDAYLLTLDRRGRIQDTTTYVFDATDDTFSSAIGLDPGGDPVWGGATLATGRVWIRKMER